MTLNAPGAPADGCVPQELTIEDPMLAHAYVPFQKWCGTYSPMGALSRGTAFPGLDNLYMHNYQVGRGRRLDNDE